jgi:F-type H+-transporting ATPase subunit beta
MNTMKTTTQTTTEAKAVVSQVIGPVVDVKFEGKVPEIYSALEITRTNGEILTLEVQQQLPGNVARTIALSSTDGIKRGMEVISLGKGISVPVGKETLGRMFNVL